MLLILCAVKYILYLTLNIGVCCRLNLYIPSPSPTLSIPYFPLSPLLKIYVHVIF